MTLVLESPNCEGFQADDYSCEPPFAEKNQPVETFVTNGAHESFRLGIGVWGVNRRACDAYAGAMDEAPKTVSPLAIPVS